MGTDEMSEIDPLEVAARLFAAIEAGDVDGVAALYAEDARIWHNHDDQVQGAEENLRTLRWVVRNLADRRYTDVRRSRTDDGFVQRHVLRGTTRAGAEVAVAACVVVRVVGGKVSELDEYLDSAQLTPLMA